MANWLVDLPEWMVTNKVPPEAAQRETYGGNVNLFTFASAAEWRVLNNQYIEEYSLLEDVIDNDLATALYTKQGEVFDLIKAGNRAEAAKQALVVTLTLIQAISTAGYSPTIEAVKELWESIDFEPTFEEEDISANLISRIERDAIASNVSAQFEEDPIAAAALFKEHLNEAEYFALANNPSLPKVLGYATTQIKNLKSAIALDNDKKIKAGEDTTTLAVNLATNISNAIFGGGGEDLATKLHLADLYEEYPTLTPFKTQLTILLSDTSKISNPPTDSTGVPIYVTNGEKLLSDILQSSAALADDPEDALNNYNAVITGSTTLLAGENPLLKEYGYPAGMGDIAVASTSPTVIANTVRTSIETATDTSDNAKVSRYLNPLLGNDPDTVVSAQDYIDNITPQVPAIPSGQQVSEPDESVLNPEQTAAILKTLEDANQQMIGETIGNTVTAYNESWIGKVQRAWQGAQGVLQFPDADKQAADSIDTAGNVVREHVQNMLNTTGVGHLFANNPEFLNKVEQELVEGPLNNLWGGVKDYPAELGANLFDIAMGAKELSLENVFSLPKGFTGPDGKMKNPLAIMFPDLFPPEFQGNAIVALKNNLSQSFKLTPDGSSYEDLTSKMVIINNNWVEGETNASGQRQPVRMLQKPQMFFEFETTKNNTKVTERYYLELLPSTPMTGRSVDGVVDPFGGRGITRRHQQNITSIEIAGSEPIYQSLGIAGELITFSSAVTNYRNKVHSRSSPSVRSHTNEFKQGIFPYGDGEVADPTRFAGSGQDRTHGLSAWDTIEDSLMAKITRQGRPATLCLEYKVENGKPFGITQRVLIHNVERIQMRRDKLWFKITMSRLDFPEAEQGKSDVTDTVSQIMVKAKDDAAKAMKPTELPQPKIMQSQDGGYGAPGFDPGTGKPVIGKTDPNQKDKPPTTKPDKDKHAAIKKKIQTTPIAELLGVEPLEKEIAPNGEKNVAAIERNKKKKVKILTPEETAFVNGPMGAELRKMIEARKAISAADMAGKTAAKNVIAEEETNADLDRASRILVGLAPATGLVLGIGGASLVVGAGTAVASSTFAPVGVSFPGFSAFVPNAVSFGGITATTTAVTATASTGVINTLQKFGSQFIGKASQIVGSAKQAAPTVVKATTKTVIKPAKAGPKSLKEPLQFWNTSPKGSLSGKPATPGQGTSVIAKPRGQTGPTTPATTTNTTPASGNITYTMSSATSAMGEIRHLLVNYHKIKDPKIAESLLSHWTKLYGKQKIDRFEQYLNANNRKLPPTSLWNMW